MGAPKLTEDQRADILRRLAAGEKPAALGREYGVSRQYVTSIRTQHLDMPKALEEAQEKRVEAVRHGLDDKDAMVLALLEDAERVRSATLDDFVTVRTIRHVARNKQGEVVDEWERDEPCIDWEKARAAGALRNLKRFTNNDKGQSVELHDVSTAASNIMHAAKLRGLLVDKVAPTTPDGQEPYQPEEGPDLSGLTDEELATLDSLYAKAEQARDKARAGEAG